MKRHELPLEEKIQLIKDNNGGLGMSVGRNNVERERSNI